MNRLGTENPGRNADASACAKVSGAAAWRKGIVLAVVVIAVIVVFATPDVRALLRSGLDGTERLGHFGQVLFVLIYIAATVLLIPGSALGLGAGALFGVVRGSLLVSLGSTVGATCAFLLARYLARGWVARKIEGRTAFAAMIRRSPVKAGRSCSSRDSHPCSRLRC